jgi:hypothetical protein
MAYVTYEIRTNPHITIHRDSCTRVKQHGGAGRGEYYYHETKIDAYSYAQTTRLPIKECYFCKP